MNVRACLSCALTFTSEQGSKPASEADLILETRIPNGMDREKSRSYAPVPSAKRVWIRDQKGFGSQSLLIRRYRNLRFRSSPIPRDPEHPKRVWIRTAGRKYQARSGVPEVALNIQYRQSYYITRSFTGFHSVSTVSPRVHYQ